jgi:curved DNA-binding protein CbpA
VHVLKPQNVTTKDVSNEVNMAHTDYFQNCTTAEEVKIEYRRLCKQWHPDLGPKEESSIRTAKMQEINAAYAQVSARYRQEEMRQKAKAKGRPEPTEQDYTDAAATDERIRQAIEKIIVFEFLEIEICGLWVWVAGTQKRGTGADNDAALDALMSAGYKWASEKKRWYFAGVPAGGFAKFKMEDIRSRYGSRIVKPSRGDRREERKEERRAPSSIGS